MLLLGIILSAFRLVIPDVVNEPGHPMFWILQEFAGSEFAKRGQPFVFAHNDRAYYAE
jgi:hypothetical protein